MKIKIIFLSLVVLATALSACGEYDFVPTLSFEVHSNSDLKQKSTIANLTLSNFNTTEIGKVKIEGIKIGEVDITNYEVKLSDGNLEVSFTLPDNADQFNILSVKASAPDRWQREVTKSY
jgi:autotransporter translocation and assembly factor TamB